MRLNKAFIGLVFLAGYVAHDIVRAIAFQPVSPAHAYYVDIEDEVVRIVERCSVYVYDVNNTEGQGDIIC